MERMRLLNARLDFYHPSAETEERLTRLRRSDETALAELLQIMIAGQLVIAKLISYFQSWV